jgi:hypothetical protein
MFRRGDDKIIFDERERLLIRHEDTWPKQQIQNFLQQPVSSVGLYDEVKNLLQQYIELTKPSAYGLLASWIMASYFFLFFYAFPFLFIYGKKQSGKSRLLSILQRLAFNAMKVKGISVASMADSIDGVRGTFLNDQAESLSDSRNAEILGILSDSYTRDGGRRRIVNISNKKRTLIEFETYAPKAFASVEDIDPDLKDRCIQVAMVRALKDFPEPEPFLPVWQEMRDKLYRELLMRWKEVREIYKDTGGETTHRLKELWRPIETILKLENVPTEEMQKIKNFFLESMMETQTDLTESEYELFEILKNLLKESGGEADFCAEEIAVLIKHKPKEDMTKRGLQIWVCKKFSQFALYDAHMPRKDKKRTFRFSYQHVSDTFKRYTPENNGFNGKLV